MTARQAEALAAFGGVKRRFTRTGEWNGVVIGRAIVAVSDRLAAAGFPGVKIIAPSTAKARRALQLQTGSVTEVDTSEKQHVATIEGGVVENGFDDDGEGEADHPVESAVAAAAKKASTTAKDEYITAYADLDAGMSVNGEDLKTVKPKDKTQVKGEIATNKADQAEEENKKD